MAEKNLNGSGLNEVWVRAAQLVKRFTGAVNLTKGDLQTQVDTKVEGKAISSSSAITTEGEYALDAREKNASVDGTLANQISILNSNLNRINRYNVTAVDTDGWIALTTSNGNNNNYDYINDDGQIQLNVNSTLHVNIVVYNNSTDSTNLSLEIHINGATNLYNRKCVAKGYETFNLALPCISGQLIKLHLYGNLTNIDVSTNWQESFVLVTY